MHSFFPHQRHAVIQSSYTKRRSICLYYVKENLVTLASIFVAALCRNTTKLWHWILLIIVLFLLAWRHQTEASIALIPAPTICRDWREHLLYIPLMHIAAARMKCKVFTDLEELSDCTFIVEEAPFYVFIHSNMHCFLTYFSSFTVL